MHQSSAFKMKICSAILILFTVFVVCCVGLDQSSEPFYEKLSLVQDDHVHLLPNLILPLDQNYSTFGHYSGYPRSSGRDTSLNYWFFKAKSDNWQTEPLLLWLGGWVSSLNGALTGISPIKMHPNGSLTLNPDSWNKRANLLFIKSFPQVGFRDSNYSEIYVGNDTTAAESTFDMIEIFFAKYPLLKENKFYVCGEGYSSFLILHGT